MSQQLISHSQDLKKLRDEGFEIEVKSGFLLVYHIPYVNSAKQIKLDGILVSELTLSSNSQTSRPSTHVIQFIGEHPCNKDGTIIAPIQHSTQNQELATGIQINHTFSNKPPEGYPDYYSKIVRYSEIISAPAKSMNSSLTERTYRVIRDEDSNSVFKYIDTNSSRANINIITSRFHGQKIGIIGLGGTGSYILDLVSKTPVQEIHLFDGDSLLQHNAFRSPGAVSAEDLDLKMSKVEYFGRVYSNMHKHIYQHKTFIGESNLNLLDELSYVFICIDKNAVRSIVIRYLLKKGISFIDVGLGINIVNDALIGAVRLTVGTEEKNDHITNRISFVDGDEENAYSTNIQIADLNALNATLAVIKWKKLSGFYQDLENEYHTIYSLNVAQLLNEDLAN